MAVALAAVAMLPVTCHSEPGRELTGDFSLLILMLQSGLFSPANGSLIRGTWKADLAAFRSAQAPAKSAPTLHDGDVVKDKTPYHATA
jgi:hypothetical protein